MCKQFICELVNASGTIEHRVNCSNMLSAIHICEGLFPDARVIDVKEA